MKISKKILSVVAGINLVCNVSVIPSKAQWLTVGDNVDKSKITQCTKRNWCWAYSGSFMLECMGITDINHTTFATKKAKHGATTDRQESLPKTLFTIRNCLSENHDLRNAKVALFYHNGDEIYIKIFNNIKETQKSAMNMLKFEKTAQDALITGIMGMYKAPSLMMLHDFEQNTNHVCVVIGVDFDFNKKVINKFKIWDMNEGEIEIDANDKRIVEVACFCTE